MLRHNSIENEKLHNGKIELKNVSHRNCGGGGSTIKGEEKGRRR